MPRRPVADFVHLHNHTEYSLLDGASRIEEVVKLAAEYGMPALAITDHGNMFGAVKFYKQAQKAGVKPIVGIETYVAPHDRRERKIHADIPESSFHLTLLARDETGYHNLMKLSSTAYLDGFYYKPRIDKELLAAHAAGLLALSGCLKGEVSYYLRRGDTDKAMQAAAGYQEILGTENFYLEVMRCGAGDEEKVGARLVELGSALDIPLVATNDCHYLRPDDARAHDALVCIQTGKRLSDTARMNMTMNQLHFRSPAEMQDLFADLPDAVHRTREVADRCNLLLDFSHIRFHLPSFPAPPGFDDSFGYLKHLAEAGLRHRYHRVTPAVEQRLAHELGVIQRMGFAGYFLVVKDIIDFARGKGVPVGPGRGSAAGSLVLYCLGITDIEPLGYGLLFERFLTTERVTLPDVDIDFSDFRRQEVIDYIRRRYGENSVAQIITFGTMQARAAVRDVGRVLDIPIGEVDRFAKLVQPNMELDEALSTVAELRSTVEEKPEYRELMTIARKLEGLNRHASIHASAVVIAPRPLIELVPLYKSSDGDVCTQFDMYALEDVGLLKMDILGLRTLTVVEEAVRLIRGSGRHIDLDKLPLDDPATFRMLQKADTVGVFQLESAGMRDLCRRMRPEKLEHIIALIALYRPGPMDLIPAYLARKAGTEPIEYEHPLLEPIARETYGVLIYQEQVMQAAQALAGYNLGRADLLRRAMGKKKPEEMAALHETFIQGCETYNRIPADKAERIFNLLAKFAGYGFNKSHAAGYAHLSYVTAYLKANFPVEFMAAVLTSELGDFKKLAKFVNESRRAGVPVKGPDVNLSQVTFSIEDKGVRFGLAGVKNLGSGASEFIVRERVEDGPYQSLLDFLVRTRGQVNRKAAESLIKAGAFDWLEPNRKSLLSSLDREMSRAASERLRFLEKQTDMFGSGEASTELARTEEKFDTHDLLAFEKEAFGFYFSSHPLEPFRAEYEALGLVPIAQVETMKDGASVALGGVITARRARKDKRDREYAILTLEDFDGTIEVLVFSDQLEPCRATLKVDNLVAAQGTVKVRSQDAGGAYSGVPQVWAEHVMAFADSARCLKGVAIEVREQEFDELAAIKLKERLAAHPGSGQVRLVLQNKDGSSRVFRFDELKVELNNALISELREVFGPDSVRLWGGLPSRPENSGRRNKPGRPDRRT
ncbi:DNA polymerase III subunit alpha [candidate division WOR-3 bacterium]|nr:DNA polymerase III subunit alpha [candidate division WOR-3 bacterium]